MGKVVRSCYLLVLAALAACTRQAPPAGAPAGFEGLRIAREEHPRAYFFRASESPGKNPSLTYEEWERTFERLMGIEGKVLDEEIPGLSERNIEFFTRFKQRHPDQIVLMHFNGNARDPRFDSGEYFAGHWIYFNGCKILSDVAAEDGESEIRVENPALFKTGVGRFRNKNEDIGLCLLDAGGKPDWRQSEQVQLISVDRERRTIRVRRGCYGTQPRSFPAGGSYAAAHVHEGPWGGQSSNLMWFYNYSTASPRDLRGRSAADVLAGELLRRYSPGGELAAFDGLEFDVLFFHNTYHPDLRNPDSGRGMDVDADGKIDNGRIGGVDTYGIGVVEFCRRLRERFPPEKVLMADGMTERNQRAFHILNGIESEGFPHLRDLEMRDWSGGLNRHFFWLAKARPPVFNYVNHKYTQPDPKTGLPMRPEIPFGIHRLAFAAAVFTDSAICYSFPPPPEPEEALGIWDELRMGVENRLGWLGKPAGPAVRLAERAPDLLEGQSRPVSRELLRRFQGRNLQFAIDRGALRVSGTDGNETRFLLRDLPTQGPDLLVAFDVRGEPMKGYPREVARLMRVRLVPGDASGFMTWVNESEFRPRFYFSDVKARRVDLEFTIEGSEPVWISGLTAHARADAMYREFERGVVLANPSPRPYLFDLGTLFPGQSFRRLRGSPGQDPQTNDGALVGSEIELPPKDALFLVRR